MALSEKQLQEAYIQLFKIIGDSKLNSKLENLAGMPTADFALAIQKGNEDAKKVTMDVVRGFGGDYNPSNNTPVLNDGAAAEKTYYRISTDGTRDFGSGEIELKAGDFIEYKAGTWNKIISQRDLDNAQTIFKSYQY